MLWELRVKLLKYFVKTMLENLEVEYLGVDIGDGDGKVDVVLIQNGVQLWLVQSVTFTGEPFYTVAIHGMVEFAFGRGDKHLVLLRHHPTDAVGKYHKLVARQEEVVNQFLTTEAVLF